MDSPSSSCCGGGPDTSGRRGGAQGAECCAGRGPADARSMLWRVLGAGDDADDADAAGAGEAGLPLPSGAHAQGDEWEGDGAPSAPPLE
jgi:hypothetical protein